MFEWFIEKNHKNKFKNAILNSDDDKAVSILEKGVLEPSFDNNWVLPYLVGHNLIKVTEFLLKNEKINLNLYNYEMLYLAMQNNQSKMVKLLLTNQFIDPTLKNNIIIRKAYKKKYMKIVNILWSDKRVRNSLEKNYKEWYYKLSTKQFKNNIFEF